MKSLRMKADDWMKKLTRFKRLFAAFLKSSDECLKKRRNETSSFFDRKMDKIISVILKYINYTTVQLAALVVLFVIEFYYGIVHDHLFYAVFVIWEIDNNYVFVTASATAIAFAGFCFSYARTQQKKSVQSTLVLTAGEYFVRSALLYLPGLFCYYFLLVTTTTPNAYVRSLVTITTYVFIKWVNVYLYVAAILLFTIGFTYLLGAFFIPKRYKVDPSVTT